MGSSSCSYGLKVSWNQWVLGRGEKRDAVRFKQQEAVSETSRLGGLGVRSEYKLPILGAGLHFGQGGGAFPFDRTGRYLVSVASTNMFKGSVQAIF